MKILDIVWDKGTAIELPESFDPFSVIIKGSYDYHTIGSLERPKTHYDEESKLITEWIAKQYLVFSLSEQKQDSEESTIKGYISTGNWIIEQLKKEKLDEEAMDDYKPITRAFQKIAAKTRGDHRKRSVETTQGNKTLIAHLNIVIRFLSFLFPNDRRAISDHLFHGKTTYSLKEPPSELCVVKTVRYIAKNIKLEQPGLNKIIADLEYKPDLRKNDLMSFFKKSRNYRNSFLYLFIAVTGINATNVMLVTLEDLDVDNDIKTSGKAVCVYKARANKNVSFEIPKDFLINFVNPFVSIFKKFNKFCNEMKLDVHLDYIGRQVYDDDGGYKRISQYYNFRTWFNYNVKPKLASHLNMLLNQQGNNDEIVEIPTPRDLRNYKSTSIESRSGHNIAAIIMQHSEETAFKYYNRRQKKEARENLGVFYADFYGFVKNLRDKIERRLTKIPAGECSATDDEKSIIELQSLTKAYITGDCTTPTGCLFCSFFVVHANQEGVYKLISMREYILLKSKVLNWHSEFDNNFGVVIERINLILQELKNNLKDRAVEWIKEAEEAVAFGLHPIWQELHDMDMALLGVTNE